ncbi:acyltransferase [Phenylobacterium sp. LjRoot219]|uniref:acyltransferase family protein n=1 Tax=Phenylobacterium sp. LjRoot219 TaxID=3342283 RepID=UPI003ED03705
MTSRLDTLDGMRGVAALAVLILHACVLFDLPYAPPNAHLGVDFFFLLSGLVISHAYERRLQAGWSFWAFAQKRIIRLFPMILAGGALGLGLLGLRQVLNQDLGWGSVALAAASNLVLAPTAALQHFRPYAFPLNMPFWSLSVEVVINFAYAAAAGFLSHRRLGAALVVAFIGLAALVTLNGGFNLGIYWRDYGLAFVRALFPFLLGVALYRLTRGLRPGPPLAAPCLAGFAVILLTPLASQHVAAHLALVALGFPALLVLGLIARAPPPLDRLCRGLGELSYPLYAMHYPIVVAFAQLSKGAAPGGAAQFGLAAAAAGTAIVVAWLALVLFDRPLRTWLAAAPRKLRAARPRPAETPAR